MSAGTGSVNFGGGARSLAQTSTVLVRIGPTGAYVWDTVYALTPGFGREGAISFDASNDLYFAQTFTNQVIVSGVQYVANPKGVLFVKHSSAAGAPLVVKMLGDSGAFEAVRLDVATSGDIFLVVTGSGKLAGITLPRATGDSQLAVVKLSPAGAVVSAGSTTGSAAFTSVAFEPLRSRYLFGYATNPSGGFGPSGNWGGGVDVSKMTSLVGAVVQ